MYVFSKCYIRGIKQLENLCNLPLPHCNKASSLISEAALRPNIAMILGIKRINKQSFITTAMIDRDGSLTE